MFQCDHQGGGDRESGAIDHVSASTARRAIGGNGGRVGCLRLVRGTASSQIEKFDAARWVVSRDLGDAATQCLSSSAAPTAKKSNAWSPCGKRQPARPPHHVKLVEAEPARAIPTHPLTTSTLQQEASRKLGFAPANHRHCHVFMKASPISTRRERSAPHHLHVDDGAQIAYEAMTAIRAMIGSDYGQQISATCPARAYQTKARNAQEATRPAPRSVKLARPSVKRHSTLTRRKLLTSSSGSAGGCEPNRIQLAPPLRNLRPRSPRPRACASA